MALAFTETIKLGYTAPNFELLEPLTAQMRNLNELKGVEGTVVMFICNHCPYVKHVNDALVKLANDYSHKGIAFVAINSNDAEAYPADSPEEMAKATKALVYPFPYLYDESQEIAKAYHAVCTPDFSIFNKDLACVYRGQLDGSRPNSGVQVTGKDIRKALDQLLNNNPIPTDQIPSVGCSIKWK